MPFTFRSNFTSLIRNLTLRKKKGFSKTFFGSRRAEPCFPIARSSLLIIDYFTNANGLVWFKFKPIQTALSQQHYTIGCVN